MNTTKPPTKTPPLDFQTKITTNRVHPIHQSLVHHQQQIPTIVVADYSLGTLGLRWGCTVVVGGVLRSIVVLGNRSAVAVGGGMRVVMVVEFVVVGGGSVVEVVVQRLHRRRTAVEEVEVDPLADVHHNAVDLPMMVQVDVVVVGGAVVGGAAGAVGGAAGAVGGVGGGAGVVVAEHLKTHHHCCALEIFGKNLSIACFHSVGLDC